MRDEKQGIIQLSIEVVDADLRGYVLLVQCEIDLPLEG